ncbi:DUF2721 domain-containing protein [bacterium]|nr:DUF2721 domain-containing protein [bacterium]
MTLDKFVAVLQLSVSPVIVISGVGLLLLSMTNRFGRVIDRARNIADLLRNETRSDSAPLHSQLKILVRRAHVLRHAITLSTAALLFTALIVIAIFSFELLGLQFFGLIIGLFVACMISLIASLVLFLYDISISMTALELEVAAPK